MVLIGLLLRKLHIVLNAPMERDRKEEAKRLIDSLVSLSSWEQLMYEIYLREAIELGLADSNEGRKTPVEDVRAEFEIGR